MGVIPQFVAFHITSELLLADELYPYLIKATKKNSNFFKILFLC